MTDGQPLFLLIAVAILSANVGFVAGALWRAIFERVMREDRE